MMHDKLQHQWAAPQARTAAIVELAQQILQLNQSASTVEEKQQVTALDQAVVTIETWVGEIAQHIRDPAHLVSHLTHQDWGDGRSSRAPGIENGCWWDASFEQAIRRAVLSDASLKDVVTTVRDIAVKMALEQEGGSLAHAARRLGVTERALQVRRASEAR